MDVDMDLGNFVGLSGERAFREEKADEVDKDGETSVLDRKFCCS